MIFLNLLKEYFQKNKSPIQNDFRIYAFLFLYKKQNFKSSKYFLIVKYFFPDLPFLLVNTAIEADLLFFKSLQPSKNDIETLEFLEKKYIWKTFNNEDSFNIPNLNSESILRIAPNPNEVPHIGNLRMILIHKYYQKKFNCKILLRFDDTDPDNKPSKIRGYSSYIAACEWASLKINKIHIASLRQSIYSEVLEKGLSLGYFYCSLNRINKYQGQSRSAEENLVMWQNKANILDFSVRIKSEICPLHLDNWVLYRLVKNEHCLKSDVGFPLLNFQGTIDDFLLNITHILRGKDLESTEIRNRELWAVLNKMYFLTKPFPTMKYWGKIKYVEGLSSSTQIANYQKENNNIVDNCILNFSMIKSLELSYEPFYEYFVKNGFSKSDHSLDVQKLKNIILRNNKTVVNLAKISSDYEEYQCLWASKKITYNKVEIPNSKIFKTEKYYFIQSKLLNKIFILSDKII